VCFGGSTGGAEEGGSLTNIMEPFTWMPLLCPSVRVRCGLYRNWGPFLAPFDRPSIEWLLSLSRSLFQLRSTPVTLLIIEPSTTSHPSSMPRVSSVFDAWGAATLTFASQWLLMHSCPRIHKVHSTPAPHIEAVTGELAVQLELRLLANSCPPAGSVHHVIRSLLVVDEQLTGTTGMLGLFSSRSTTHYILRGWKFEEAGY
jgi:hypothetical protein